MGALRAARLNTAAARPLFGVELAS